MKMNVTDTVNMACGHWPRILPALGVPVIRNRHQACPVCGGSDRFRFDDKEGRGTWFCNQCGAGDGLKLVEKVFGVSASEAAGKVNDLIGSPCPCIFDETAGIMLDHDFVKLIAWYDNEWGYSNMVVRMLEHMAAVDAADERGSRKDAACL